MEKYDCFTCEKLAKEYGLSLDSILSELDDYDERFVLFWLANRHGIDLQKDVAECTYTSVWDAEGEITSKAMVNLNTKKITILESFDPAECCDEDGEPFECNILEKEYVTINGTQYLCHNRNEESKWDEKEYEKRKNEFWYQ